MCLCLLFSHIQPVTGSQCSVVLYGRGAERHLGLGWDQAVLTAAESAQGAGDRLGLSSQSV